MNKELKGIRKEQGCYAVHVNKGDTTYIYIGSGILGERCSSNPSKLRRNVHANKQLQDEFNIVKDCKIEILDVCVDSEEARNMENVWIEHFRKIEGVVVCNIYKGVTTKKYKILLDEVKIREIMDMLNDKNNKLRQKDIAEIYGVTQCEISKIKTGKRWGNV